MKILKNKADREMETVIYGVPLTDKLWVFGDQTTQIWDENGYSCKTKKAKDVQSR